MAFQSDREHPSAKGTPLPVTPCYALGIGRAIANATTQPGRLIARGDHDGASALLISAANSVSTRRALVAALECSRQSLWRWEKDVAGLTDALDEALYG